MAAAAVACSSSSRSRIRGRANAAGPLASRLLFFLLLASAPCRGRSFLLGSCGGGGVATTTSDRTTSYYFGVRRGGGDRDRHTDRHDAAPCRERGRAGLVLGMGSRGVANEGGEGAGGGSRTAGAARGRMVSSGRTAGMPLGGRGMGFATIMTGATSLGRPTVAHTASSRLVSTSPAAAGAGAGAEEAGAGGGISHKKEEKVNEEEEEEQEEERVPTAGELLVKARTLYNDKFGRPEDVQEVFAGYAPGRVNLIGEHTDYQGGFVMPLALERGTVVYGVGRLVNSDEVAAAAEDSSSGWCHVVSETMLQAEEKGGGGDGGGEAEVRFRADETLEPGEPEWANYVKGVVKEFMAKMPEGKRLELAVTVVGTVPLGGGVSSSASLAVAMGTFLQGVFSSAGVSPLSSKEKAHLCRMAEHNFLDMPCGIMDQFVTSMAMPGHAMLLDCRSEEADAVPLSDPNLVVVVTNSNVKHALAGSQYPVRVTQCKAARDALQKSHPEVQLLRDATPEQVEEMKGSVEDAVFRRARHVVSENARTTAAAEALRDGDYQTVGGFMLDSHRSLREDFEVSCSELDVLVELAMEVEGVFGSRLTGGGFGGCTVTLVEKDSVESLIRHLREGYSRILGRDCSSFVTKPGFGARGLSGAAAATDTTWPE